MEFKDKLIDKLQIEIYEYMGYRDKNNAELVKDTLSRQSYVFKNVGTYT